MSDIENETFDPFDDLSGAETEIEAPTADAEETPVVETPGEESATEQPAAEPEEDVPAQEKPEEKPAKMVPLAALEGERKKRQALEAELAALQQQPQPAAQPVQPAQQQQAPPDPWDENFLANVQGKLGQVEQLESRLRTMQTNFVEVGLTAAAEKLGDEAFQQTYETVKNDPQMAAFVFNHPDPRGAFLLLHENISRQQIASQIPAGMSLDDFVVQRFAELQASGKAPAQEQQAVTTGTPKPEAPPRSLASAPGTAGTKRPPLSADPFDDIL